MKNYAFYQTKFGYFRMEYEHDYITLLKKYHGKDPEDFGKKTPLTENAYTELCEYLEGQRKDFTFKYMLKGTEFQKKVWQALCEIPYGCTCSYKDIAIAIGNEKACRAVGLANNKNPITLAVPCHRVIGKNGKLVGYAGGIEMKKYLLHMESQNI